MKYKPNLDSYACLILHTNSYPGESSLAASALKQLVTAVSESLELFSLIELEKKLLARFCQQGNVMHL